MLSAILRDAPPDVFGAISELLVQVYVGGGFTPSERAHTLRNIEDRARSADVIIAVDHDTEALIGVVFLLNTDSRYRQVALDGEAELQLLAVDPAARHRGVGEALVRECIRRARGHRATRLVLFSQPTQTAAHRVYQRAGFRRLLARDFERVGHGCRLVFGMEL